MKDTLIEIRKEFSKRVTQLLRSLKLQCNKNTSYVNTNKNWSENNTGCKNNKKMNIGMQRLRDFSKTITAANTAALESRAAVESNQNLLAQS